MDVNFELQDGKLLCVEIDPFDTVLDVKLKLQEFHHIPISQQTFIFDGQILDDRLDVWTSQIRQGSTISLLSDAPNLVPPPLQPMTTQSQLPPMTTDQSQLPPMTTDQSQFPPEDVDSMIDELMATLQETNTIVQSLPVSDSVSPAQPQPMPESQQLPIMPPCESPQPTIAPTQELQQTPALPEFPPQLIVPALPEFPPQLIVPALPEFPPQLIVPALPEFPPQLIMPAFQDPFGIRVPQIPMSVRGKASLPAMPYTQPSPLFRTPRMPSSLLPMPYTQPSPLFKMPRLLSSLPPMSNTQPSPLFKTPRLPSSSVEKKELKESRSVPKPPLKRKGKEVQESRQIGKEVQESRQTTVDVKKGDGGRKLKVIVVPMRTTERIEIEVNSEDDVAVLREKLNELQKKLEFRLPEDGRYFFIHGQAPMEEEQSFQWHQVKEGDTIDTFDGFLSDPIKLYAP